MRRHGGGARVAPLSVALLALLAAACGDERVGAVAREVRVSPEAVEFPRTFVGYPTTAQVTVENTGQAAEALQAEVAGPFLLSEPATRIPGGGTVRLEVSFAPAAPGPATGTLSVEAAGQRFEIPLAGVAVPAPACTTAEACRISRFDPETGSCIHDPAPDDTECSSQCVGAGRCLDGVCRGAGDGCDDGNPCTRDLMAADCSCRHEPLEEKPTEDPCRRETCVDGVGWVVDDAPDGTVCGPVNECTGRFCAGGVCAPATEAPEGTICGPGTPCQLPGRCRRGTTGLMSCVTPPPTATLAPVWREAPTGGRHLRFEAVADDRYLYWAECDEEGCGLRSISPVVEREGVGGIDPDPSRFEYHAFDRWSGALPMFAGEVARDGGLALSGGLVFSTLRAGWVEAYDARTGAPAFRLDLAGEGVPVGRGATAINAFGDLVLLVAEAAGSPPRTVLAISPAGTIAWRTPRHPDHLWGLVADEDGNVYVGAETVDGARLLSLDGAGRVRFVAPAVFATPLAAFDGRVLLGDGTLFATLDGAAVGEPLPLLVPELALPPLLSPTSGYLAGYPLGEHGPRWSEYTLQRFDPETGAALDVRPLEAASASWDRSDPLLLEGPMPSAPEATPPPPGETVLLAEGPGGDSCTTPPVLREAREGGPARWSCALTPGSYGGPATVLSSLWITHDACSGTVAAFLLEVAGEEPRALAAEGWLGGGGEPGRGARPRR